MADRSDKLVSLDDALKSYIEDYIWYYCIKRNEEAFNKIKKMSQREYNATIEAIYKEIKDEIVDRIKDSVIISARGFGIF